MEDYVNLRATSTSISDDNVSSYTTSRSSSYSPENDNIPVPTRPEKYIAYILRHKAIDFGLDIDARGYVDVNALINHPQSKAFNFTTSFIRAFVINDNKHRYELEETSTTLKIRAVQGHSIRKVSDIDLLTPITNIFAYPNVIHGTYHQAWTLINENGLNRMSRNHIHFSIGYLNDEFVQSGMKKDTQVIIELNAGVAYYNGIPLYISKNNVILSPGIDGVVERKYFKKVIDVDKKKVLFTTEYTVLLVINASALSACVVDCCEWKLLAYASNICYSSYEDMNRFSMEMVKEGVCKRTWVVVVNRKDEESYCVNVKKLCEGNLLVHPGFYVDYIVVDDTVNESVIVDKQMMFNSGMSKQVNVDYGKYYMELRNKRKVSLELAKMYEHAHNNTNNNNNNNSSNVNEEQKEFAVSINWCK